MSCPWMENRQMKTEEKMREYGPLRWELNLQYLGYKVSQHNIIRDVLGGYLKDVKKSIKCLIGDRRYLGLKRVHKAILSFIMHSGDCRNLETLKHRTISKERQR